MKCGHLHTFHQFFSKNSPFQVCIESIPLFRHLSFDEQCKIAKLAVRRTYRKGEIIFSPGDVSENLFIVFDGRVKLSRLSASGKEQILQILEPGDFTGDLSLFKQSPMKSMAEALEATEICMIPGKGMKKLVKRVPSIAIKLLEEYTERIEHAENLIEQLGLYDVEQRVAGLILTLAKDKEVNETGEIPLNLTISKRDLASTIGTSQETLSRKLASLQEKKLIKLKGQRNIILLNREGLQNIIMD